MNFSGTRNNRDTRARTLEINIWTFEIRALRVTKITLRRSLLHQRTRSTRSDRFAPRSIRRRKALSIPRRYRGASTKYSVCHIRIIAMLRMRQSSQERTARIVDKSQSLEDASDQIDAIDREMIRANLLFVRFARYHIDSHPRKKPFSIPRGRLQDKLPLKEIWGDDMSIQIIAALVHQMRPTRSFREANIWETFFRWN